MTAATGEGTRRLGETPDPTTLDAAEGMGVDELRAVQLERLQETLQHAYANVPHYRRAFDAAGVHPDDCRELADLAKFPMTSKADLRENYPFGMFAVPQDQIRRGPPPARTPRRARPAAYTQKDLHPRAPVTPRALPPPRRPAPDQPHHP